MLIGAWLPRTRAPHLETSINSRCPFLHSREPPVAIAARTQHFWIDAAPVITNHLAQVRSVRDLHTRCLRVPDRVHQRFPPDAIDIVPNESVLHAPPSFHSYTET